MPLYQYKCEKCKEEFEALVFGDSEESAVVCPKCKKRDKIKKVISITNFEIKGYSAGNGYSKKQD